MQHCIMKHQIMQTCIMEHHVMQACIVEQYIMQHCIMEHQIMQTCIMGRHIMQHCILKHHTCIMQACVVKHEIAQNALARHFPPHLAHSTSKWWMNQSIELLHFFANLYRVLYVIWRTEKVIQIPSIPLCIELTDSTVVSSVILSSFCHHGILWKEVTQRVRDAKDHLTF